MTKLQTTLKQYKRWDYRIVLKVYDDDSAEIMLQTFVHKKLGLGYWFDDFPFEPHLYPKAVIKGFDKWSKWLESKKEAHNDTDHD